MFLIAMSWAYHDTSEVTSPYFPISIPNLKIINSQRNIMQTWVVVSWKTYPTLALWAK